MCSVCARIGHPCLLCRRLPPSPGERYAPDACLCGARLRAGKRFCPQCGSFFTMAETGAVQQPVSDTAQIVQEETIIMALINTQSRKGGSTGEFKLLETDVYRMKIADASLEEDQFAEPLNDGTKPIKLVLRWEVTAVSEDQDEDAAGCAVWQRFNPYYGNVREGGPSKFKAFIDALREQGHLEEFDPGAFDTDQLVGIEQRVSVEKYAKTMGANAGKPGNRVNGIMPLKRAKKEARNVPQPVAAGEVEEADLPF